jgi:hypothetical protein
MPTRLTQPLGWPRLVPDQVYLPAWSCAGEHSQLAALIDMIRSKSWTSWPARVQGLSCRRNMDVDMKDEDGHNDMSAARPTVPLGTTDKAITRVGFGACASRAGNGRSVGTSRTT